MKDIYIRGGSINRIMLIVGEFREGKSLSNLQTFHVNASRKHAQVEKITIRNNFFSWTVNFRLAELYYVIQMLSRIIKG